MKIGVFGYGRLGEGVVQAVEKSEDAQLVGVFTRRPPEQVQAGTHAPVFAAGDVFRYADQIDVLVNCGGSMADLPATTPFLARYFHVVDSFDTHANINEHFNAVHEEALKGRKCALISAGWDPGLFSLIRVYAAAFLPEGRTYTFWGKGVSQGHSDAVRRIQGVKSAVQYTVPKPEAVQAVQSGDTPSLTASQMHERICYVVPLPGSDQGEIAEKIKAIPHYFAEYDTTVRFISEEELIAKHGRLPHGGRVIRRGHTSEQNGHTLEFSLALDSNPEFTGSILVSFARALSRLAESGHYGAKTVFDIPPALLLPHTGDTLRAQFL